MDIQNFVDDLQVEAPLALDSTLERTTMASVVEFFREAECWRYPLTLSLDGVAYAYPLPLPDNTIAFSVGFANYIHPNELVYPLQATLYERLSESTGEPVQYALAQGELLLDAPGVFGGQVKTSLVLVPTFEATEIPDEIANNYFEGIRAGALARLLSMPDKEWYNRAAAAVQYQVYEKAKVECRRHYRRDRHRPARRVRYGGL